MKYTWQIVDETRFLEESSLDPTDISFRADRKSIEKNFLVNLRNATIEEAGIIEEKVAMPVVLLPFHSSFNRETM